MYIMLSIVGWAWVAISGIYLWIRLSRDKGKTSE
jgi:hypothetical protein